MRLGTLAFSASGVRSRIMRREISETTIASMREMSANACSASVLTDAFASGWLMMRTSSFLNVSVCLEMSPW